MREEVVGNNYILVFNKKDKYLSRYLIFSEFFVFLLKK